MTNTGLKNTEITLINTVFALHTEIEKAILYGSRAKGNYKPASDIDIREAYNLVFSDLSDGYGEIRCCP